MDRQPASELLKAFLISGQLEKEDKYKIFERLLEIFTIIAVVIGLLIIQLPFAQDLNKPAIYKLAAIVGVFVVFWYHVLPKRFSGRMKRFVYSLITLTFIAFLVHYTNGVRGYTIFFYYLSLLPVSMTLPLRYTFVTTFYSTILVFTEAFLTKGSLQTNLSLALLNSWGFVLVVFYSRFNSGEAVLVKKAEEDNILEKEKTVGKLKDEFVYIISHELKQPAISIKGYIDNIFSKFSSTINLEDKEILDLTNTNSVRLTKLLDDLLDISQIEKGSLRIVMTDVSLRPIINEVLSTLLLEAKEKRISLSQKMTEEVGANADVDRLKEVLTNLINNAIKYTPEGGRVIVEAKREGDSAKILVSDNGIGISEEDQKHLFEKFYRIENERTRAVKGSGLGLFITKQLVEKMGGQVGVVSKAEEGTTFYITLPRYR